MFAPDGGVPDSSSHPFRVARFTNATKGLLERGPIAVFEKGAFLGQGMLDPLPPKATATVPFALERSLAVESERHTLELGARLFKIEAGELVVQRDKRDAYSVQNKKWQRAECQVARAPPAARCRASVQGPLWARKTPRRRQRAGADFGAGGGRAELTVEERQPTEERTDWLSPIADDAVKAYLADPRADHGLVVALSSAWGGRDALKKAGDERNSLTQSQAELEKSARETRLSLEAIEKNKQASRLGICAPSSPRAWPT